ncbi:EF-hand domain-containing protein [Olleya sp. R77988]|uniref:EF-hand domain-containing protein n=1 Tax=Olleya sp. R77988 TaxID=3093875 RepID=UPI0037CA90EC
MKKQLTSLAIVALLIGFTSCKSSNETTNTSNSAKTETTEKRNQPRERGERPDASQMLAEMDANKDGKLSKDEVKGPLQDQFSKIDTNDDDFISKEELENAPKPQRGGGQGGRPQRGGN